MLESLSIVIPTYGRRKYLVRTLTYLSKYPVSVIVVDGSETALNQKESPDRPSRITYYHLPGLSIAQRLGYASKHISTEYVIMLGDDEYYIPSSLEKCIRELESDPQLVACTGRALSFKFSNEGVIGKLSHTDQKDYFIDDPTPKLRLQHQMNPYRMCTTYAVTRTKAWAAAVETVEKSEWKAFALEEMQIEISLGFLGTSKVIPYLMWLRSEENENIDIKQNRRTPVDIWFRDLKEDQKDSVVNEISITLEKYSQLSPQAINESVRAAFESFISGQAKSVITSKPVQAILKSLPDFLRILIRRTYSNWISIRKPLPAAPALLEACALQLEETGVIINYPELMEISSSIRNSYKQEIGSEGALIGC